MAYPIWRTMSYKSIIIIAESCLITQDSFFFRFIGSLSMNLKPDVKNKLFSIRYLILHGNGVTGN